MGILGKQKEPWEEEERAFFLKLEERPVWTRLGARENQPEPGWSEGKGAGGSGGRRKLPAELSSHKMKSVHEASGTFRRLPLLRGWASGRRWGTVWKSGCWETNLGDEGRLPRIGYLSWPWKAEQEFTRQRIAVPAAETSKCKTTVVEEVWGVFGKG